MAAEGPSAPAPRGEHHGGNRIAIARRLGCRPEQLLDSSASLVPFGPPATVRRTLRRALSDGDSLALRDYPDRSYGELRRALADHHGLDPDGVLPGNGAAELFTWAARDAGCCGTSLLPTPGFADYRRALDCWGAPWQAMPMPTTWPAAFPQPFPPVPGVEASAEVIWITNPHNPTGQLWSRESLEPLLDRFALVIADEAFLPLVPGGEAQSLIPLLAGHPNLVVIRSLTKLFAVAGLRLGYGLGAPERLRRWSRWRDPWPVNGLAAAAGQALLGDGRGLERWSVRVQRWVARDGPRLASALATIPGLVPLPSAANYLLVRGERQGRPVSLEPRRLALEGRHRILLRDCRSFEGLGACWLRVALQDSTGNRRLLKALQAEAGERLS